MNLATTIVYLHEVPQVSKHISHTQQITMRPPDTGLTYIVKTKDTAEHIKMTCPHSLALLSTPVGTWQHRVDVNAAISPRDSKGQEAAWTYPLFVFVGRVLQSAPPAWHGSPYRIRVHHLSTRAAPPPTQRDQPQRSLRSSELEAPYSRRLHLSSGPDKVDLWDKMGMPFNHQICELRYAQSGGDTVLPLRRLIAVASDMASQ